MNLADVATRLLAAGLVTVSIGGTVRTQPTPSTPAVGVVEATRRLITESNEFLGRVEAVNRVNVTARVTAALEQRLFNEGAEIKKGDQLYRLERGPFEADLAAKQAQVAQLEAMLENARLTTERAHTLLGGPAGQQSTYDAALATQRSLQAQVQAAQAQVQASQINLDYTVINAPIDGKIGRTAVTEGNIVGPSSGVLTTIVSQDPMHVTFPVPLREGLELRERYLPQGGLEAVTIRLRLPDGRMYGQSGRLNFVDNSIAQNTDTIMVRGEIANPILRAPSAAGVTAHELTDGEFVTVLLEGVQPIEVLAIPRAAVLSDQRGDYVLVVGKDNKAEERRVQLGQSTATIAAVIGGLAAGDKVIAEGLQRVRAGQTVAPDAASALLRSSMDGAASEAPPRSGRGTPIRPHAADRTP
ncbi:MULTISPECIES: efflux RND transporter periplasmic adaptor subunit [unclassified Bradyrhizobium]|uniref:efflux RND transporter periplasmic adaptor subunit n=1 Tax=unclassified Bradyrhizobium TaxID=2631580 RepID=UPI001CD46E12|nr:MULTISPECIES: efflux RND transporter periplasmic adaptor subunit [unclassified Bradyrhizobium]MCA1384419.1 efflux RND transporter periplasmic adaptor subunit [Bradyrhizobium sp. BRP05]MCA1376446.1 efflux RND transporter periplasmic adaptor subunit [Bradyrhizobium sp. IC4060]MCA1421148.1 efflux RND transporter periplasmic adaptor subunit [Bradyrhizobium sp. BRP23]MCA1484211.1 efflux RND transporter periplasmic adaptor subunit [Bradyrhizobium sp. IC4061]MCA1539811.1 efflux RND transporter per